MNTDVITTRGRVRGTWDGNRSVFLGIPYAAPVVDSRRLLAPELAPSRSETFVATQFSPPPPQYPFRGTPPAPERASGHVAGEYLTLNIWSPDASRDAGLPVMVWFYGGAYRFGSTDQPIFDGDSLAGHGVVIVTVNYRVGVEGYLALKNAPNNRALLDQILALQWIHEEIGGFGGDPDRITVFGESAGAGSVATLMVAPRAKGLFANAIVHSLPGTTFTPDLASDITQELLRPLGVDDTVEAVSQIPADVLVNLVNDLQMRMPQIHRWGPVCVTPTPFSPVMDGETLPVDLWDALAQGAARDVRLLVGHNRDEWKFFQAPMGQLTDVPPELVDRVAHVLGPGPRSTALERQRAARGPMSDADLFSVQMSDGLFRMPTSQLASAHARGGGAAYRCELTWAAPAGGGILGACHVLDVPLVFGTLAAEAQLFGDHPPADAYAISAQMQSVWTEFARSGNPGWPRSVGDSWPTRLFDGNDSPTVTDYPETASRALWAPHPITTIDLQA